ncbi:type IX secretion/gliding motility protein PorT/SprT [Algoriphagus mannitolivorans]|uniref:type IX secretion/gliding motility protein PorT/SprT n=1 Tax=Algoriphagus mannitolivorans TaxID=226504 RepID=UPI00047D2B71|nr:outer membrane beta-barrel protein [Algoriphagus mannitolivorans]
MQTTHFWYQLHLCRAKVIFSVLLLVFGLSDGFAQGLFGLTSTSGSDDKPISYGFFLSGHTSGYQLRYSEAFVKASDPVTGGVHSIYPKLTPGFSLGFIGILRFHDQVNLLFTPKIGFYEYHTEVNYFASPINNLPGTGNPSPSEPNAFGIRTEELVNEETVVELPLLFKYRSQRFNNTRMYFIGGGSYQFRTKSQDEANVDPIVTSGKDFTIEAGMGFEIYFRFFKFAPEIRFSHGLNNLYLPEKTDPAFASAIESLRRKSITIYLNFQ